MNHLRFYMGGSMLSWMCHVTSSDKIYCALPLYHSAGGMVGISSCMNSGAEIVIRDKFSVSGLSDDIVKHGCTVLQYIGEFARFALNGSKDPEKDKLCGKTLRVAFGNGMRPEVRAPETEPAPPFPYARLARSRRSGALSRSAGASGASWSSTAPPRATRTCATTAASSARSASCPASSSSSTPCAWLAATRARAS